MRSRQYDIAVLDRSAERDDGPPVEAFDRPSGGGLLDIPTAAAFEPLLTPRRFLGARGGRGSAKSRFFASRTIEQCYTDHHRVVCTREFQSSIKDSVKQLLEDTIVRFDLGDNFRSTETEIVGPNESLIVFRGLNSPSTGRSGTAVSMKSLEGFDRCWVEEAHSISRRSLELLIPTFRAPGSQLWFSWNPNRFDDPVEALFRDNEGDPDFCVVTVNYRDNPWFPQDLRGDMERDRARDPDKYAHVWLGEFQRISDALVFRNWRIEAFETLRTARFYFGADWGYANDPTVLVRAWVDEPSRTLYIDHELYAVGVEIDDLPRFFSGIPYSKQWPIRADSARPETISYMQRNGYPKMRPAQKGPSSVEDGVEFLKSYDIVIHPRCVHTIDEFSKYSWKVDPKTQAVLPTLEDKSNHVIDSCRYLAEDIRLGPASWKITPELLAAARRPTARTIRRSIV